MFCRDPSRRLGAPTCAFVVPGGKSLNGRPALAKALEAVRSHEADALIVAKLNRLSRSSLDFAGLMESARSEGWA